MTNIRRALEAAAAGGDSATYVEDVFSTYVYTGTGATLAINNGIDLSGEGGLVWIKNRTNTNGHRQIDTNRGVLKVLESYDETAEATESGSLTAFNSNGFTVGDSVHTNEVNDKTVSWTFRKAPGFFDVVTYTGNGANRTISHNLECVPAFIVVKRTSSAEDWTCYQHDVGATKYLQLNGTGAADTLAEAWNDTAPTSSVFTVGTHARVNTDTETYVAYLFAGTGDAASQIFGADSDESIIKCGTYTGNASADGPTISLGWEPQYVLIKNTSASGNWYVMDIMRGIVTGGNSARLSPNLSDAESSGGVLEVNADGFKIINDYSNWNGSGNTLIYIAIRRPMKVPEAGTEVFAVDTKTTGNPNWDSNFPVDFSIFKQDITGAYDNLVFSRLTGTSYVKANSAQDKRNGGTDFAFDYMEGWGQDGSTSAVAFSWMFKRAAEFMDVVTWGGASGTLNSVAHGLGVVPELVMLKYRNATDSWYVYTSATGYMILDTAGGIVGTTDYMASTTASVLNVTGLVSNPANEPIAFLFATVAGVSKVGTYTADGTLTTINCGFSAGARFILIKRTDAEESWFLYDSLQGITAGNDPYLRLNADYGQVTGTDYIDPDSSGFQLTAAGSSTINVDTGTYIFLAIA